MDRIKVEITGEKSVKPIVIGSDEEDKTITNLEIFFDTIDNNTRVKNSDMLAKLTIDGEYAEADNGSAVVMKNLFDWAKEKTGSANYRTVNIEIFDKEAERASRKYTFPDMFVLDYKETFGKTKTEFQMVLTQKESSFFKSVSELV